MGMGSGPVQMARLFGRAPFTQTPSKVMDMCACVCVRGSEIEERGRKQTRKRGKKSSTSARTCTHHAGASLLETVGKATFSGTFHRNKRCVSLSARARACVCVCVCVCVSAPSHTTVVRLLLLLFRHGFGVVVTAPAAPQPQQHEPQPSKPCPTLLPGCWHNGAQIPTQQQTK